MTSKRRVTLSDVAARAGVSVTTASYVLNGRSEEMRLSVDASDRVRAAAAHLAYRPNRVARNLRMATTSTIGVISDHVASGAYASRMLTGAATAARAGDHLMVIGETEGDRTIETGLIEEMLDRRVDGIVYATLAHTEVDVPALLQQVPTVLLNCVDAAGRRPCVVPDDTGGGRIAGEALIAAGVSDGIHVVGEDPTPRALAGHLRLQGLRARLGESGIDLTGVVPCVWDVRAAFEAVGAWLADGARPSALVCLNDRVAMGAYQALSEAGLSVPDDVSVVGFDGSELAGWLRPDLTSVALPFPELGAAAVELLLDPARADGDVVRVGMSLRRGGSVRPARPRARRTASGSGRG